MIARRLVLVAAALSAIATLIIIAKDVDRLPIALIFIGPAVLFGTLGLRDGRSGTP